MSYDIVKLKEQYRCDLAKLSFDEKIAVLIRIQKISREIALAAGREFRGVVWGERGSKEEDSPPALGVFTESLPGSSL